jgi:hypothetical protein
VAPLRIATILFTTLIWDTLAEQTTMAVKGTAGMTTRHTTMMNTIAATNAQTVTIARDMSTLLIITSISTSVSRGRSVTAMWSTSMVLAATGK